MILRQGGCTPADKIGRYFWRNPAEGYFCFLDLRLVDVLYGISGSQTIAGCMSGGASRIWMDPSS